MSVLLENEVGWLVDHQQEINNTYATTYMFENYRLCDYLGKRANFVSGRQISCIFCSFKVVPELFAIHHTYVMDSHFAKSAKINQTSDNSDLLHCNSTHELADRSTMPSAIQPAVKSKVNVFYDNCRTKSEKHTL